MVMVDRERNSLPREVVESLVIVATQFQMDTILGNLF